METISSAEDDVLSTSSSIHRINNQSVVSSTESSINLRRSLSTNNNETIRNDEELTEENRQEGNLLQISPKRRQSRTTSSNTKVNSQGKSNQSIEHLHFSRMIQHQISQPNKPTKLPRSSPISNQSSLRLLSIFFFSLVSINPIPIFSTSKKKPSIVTKPSRLPRHFPSIVSPRPRISSPPRLRLP